MNIAIAPETINEKLFCINYPSVTSATLKKPASLTDFKTKIISSYFRLLSALIYIGVFWSFPFANCKKRQQNKAN